MTECFIYEQEQFLLKEANEVRARSGITGPTTVELMANIEHQGVIIKDHSFLIAGARLTSCLIGTTVSLLARGARSIAIDFVRCRDFAEIQFGYELLTPKERERIFMEKFSRHSDDVSRISTITNQI